MYRRSKKRVRMVLSVRACGHDANGAPFNLLTHTLDIALSGARLGGVTLPLKIGDILEIQRKHLKTQMKVIWIGEPNTPRQGQVGLEAVNQDFAIWDLELPSDGEQPVLTMRQQKTSAPAH